MLNLFVVKAFYNLASCKKQDQREFCAPSGWVFR